MSSIIDLGPSQRFVNRCNTVCFFLTIACTAIVSEYGLPFVSYIGLLGLVSLCGLIINWPKQHVITHFVLNEAYPGKCMGIQKVGGEHQSLAVLCERRSRYSQFGFWLAFKEMPEKKCSSLFRRAKVQWVFIPKFLMCSSHYKSVCRHLIWQT